VLVMCGDERDKITAMATPEEATFVAEAVSALCEPMYRSVEKAADTAQLHFVEHDMAKPIHQLERTDLTRAHRSALPS
jgi:hypothetical protein